MKTIVILDSELNSTHPMEAVMGRRGYVVYRSATTAEAIALCEDWVNALCNGAFPRLLTRRKPRG